MYKQRHQLPLPFKRLLLRLLIHTGLAPVIYGCCTCSTGPGNWKGTEPLVPGRFHTV